MINLTPALVLDEDVVVRLWVTQDGLLAYLVSEDAGVNVILITPCDETMIEALKANTLPVRDALTGPHMLLVHQGHDGTQDVRSVTAVDVPHLPLPGVFLRLGSGSTGDGV